MASSPLFPSSARLATLVSHSNRPHITRSFKVAIVLTLGVFSVLFVGLLHASLYTSVRAHGTHKGRTQARPLLDTADAYARSDASEALGAFDDDHVLVDRAHVDGQYRDRGPFGGSTSTNRKNAQGCEDVRRQNGEYEEQLFNLRIDVESLRKEITYTKHEFDELYMQLEAVQLEKEDILANLTETTARLTNIEEAYEAQKSFCGAV